MVQEKFRRFEDRGTGLMPFEPLSGKIRNPLLRFFRAILGLVLILVRLPLFLLISTMLLLVQLLAALLIIPPLQRLVLRLLHAPLVRLLLLVLGFWWISSYYHHLPGRRKSETPGWPTGSNVSRGSVLVSNHLSYVELLYLSFRFSPVFTGIIVGKDELAGSVVPLGLLGAVANTRPVSSLNPKNAVSVEAAIKRARGAWAPLVLLAEGTTGNGIALLPFRSPVTELSRLTPAPEVNAVTFRYGWKFMNPSYVVGSRFGHLLRLMAQVYNVLEVRHLPPRDIPKMGALPPDNGEDKALGWAEQLRRTMASTLGVKCVETGVEVKQEFAAAWDTERWGVTKKKA